MSSNKDNIDCTKGGSETQNILGVIAAISSSVAGYATLSSLLDQIVKTTMQTLRAEVCSIFLEDKQGSPGLLTMLAGSGFAARMVGKASYKIGEGFTGFIAKSGKVHNIKSRSELEQLTWNGRHVWLGKHDAQQWPEGTSQFRNCIAIPLRLGDRTIGVIKAENKVEEYGDYFSSDDELYLTTIANIISLAIENVRLREEGERKLRAFAAKAAHRIGNQTTNYDGLSLDLKETIQSSVPDKKELIRVRERLDATTITIKRMMEELRSFGKPLRIKRELLNLHKIISDEVWLARPPKNITIETNLSADVQQTLVDGSLFSEAMKELINNAIRAIVRSHIPKGLIRIFTRVEAGGSKEASNIAIDIIDNGPGFPENYPILEPFFTTDPKGTGLGLFTVKELMEAHGGTIAVKNSEGGGAHVTLTLPAVET